MHDFYRHLPALATFIAGAFLLALACGMFDSRFPSEEFRRWRISRKLPFLVTGTVLTIASLLIYLRETGFFLQAPGL